jgi:CcmD family protein
MTDAGFVIAAYAVIIGGLGLYAFTLGRRLTSARRELDGDDESR